MKHLVRALGYCLLAAASGVAAEPCKLYFLGGQSNMEGFGFAAELPAQYRGSVPAVAVFTGKRVLDDQPDGGIGTWDVLRPGYGLGFDTDGERNRHSDRFGPELTFGHRIAALNPDGCVALVKYALGGSGLAIGIGYGNWSPDYRDGRGTNQYDHALTALRSAFASRGGLLRPAGIVWMQGEADAFDSEAAAQAYRANLERLMDLLRAALRVDGLPVVLGKITDSGMAEDGTVMDHIGIVQRAQASFAHDDGCATLVTEIDDYRHIDDGWHYDSAAYVRMGIAFAEAMHALEARCPGAAVP